MENVFSTSKYKIIHSIEEPSKLLDYDYDPENPSRRFVSTYIHKMTFLDPIMETDIVSISFSSEVAIKLIAGITNMIYKEVNRPLMYTLKEIYLKDECIPAMATIYRNRDSDIIISIIIRNAEPVRLIFTFNEAEYLIKNLEEDEHVDTCMNYSENFYIESAYGKDSVCYEELRRKIKDGII